MIVRLEADGAVVTDADDCSVVHLRAGSATDRLRAALAATGVGALVESDGARAAGARGGRDTGPGTGLGTGGDVAVLDIAVLRSRARLMATTPDRSRCSAETVADAGDRLTDDGRGLRVPVERP